MRYPTTLISYCKGMGHKKVAQKLFYHSQIVNIEQRGRVWQSFVNEV